GWDCRNVYVIASRSSTVSEIRTEQTPGRGMRLPFGVYTGMEILDTLEVLAHERYEDLLKRAGVLNQAFIDYRPRAALRINAHGQRVVVSYIIDAGRPALLHSARHPPVRDDAARPVVTSAHNPTAQL